MEIEYLVLAEFSEILMFVFDVEPVVFLLFVEECDWSKGRLEDYCADVIEGGGLGENE